MARCPAISFFSCVRMIPIGGSLCFERHYTPTKSRRRGGGVELVHSPQEIEDLIREDGVRFIVVSDEVPLDFESQKMLRDLLRHPSYKELGRFPIGGNDLPPNDSLVLYENLKWAPPAAKYLTIKMLTTGHDIVVPWDSLGALQTK